MDLTNPIRSIAPTVDADVLAVLVATARPMSARRIHQRCGRSYSQVHAVLNRMVHDGLVLVERYGSTGAYELNRDHVLAGAVLALAEAPQRVEALITDKVAALDPPPVLLAIFGSFARRDGDPDSDIDILLIRDSGLDGDAPDWSEARHDLARSIERATGNRVQIVELDEREWSEAVEGRQPLVASLRRDAVVLFGDASIVGRPAARVDV